MHWNESQVVDMGGISLKVYYGNQKKHLQILKKKNVGLFLVMLHGGISGIMESRQCSFGKCIQTLNCLTNLYLFITLTSKFSSHSFNSKALDGSVSYHFSTTKTRRKTLSLPSTSHQRLFKCWCFCRRKSPMKSRIVSMTSWNQSEKKKPPRWRCFWATSTYFLGKTQLAFANLPSWWDKDTQSTFNLEWPPANPANPKIRPRR